MRSFLPLAKLKRTGRNAARKTTSYDSNVFSGGFRGGLMVLIELSEAPLPIKAAANSTSCLQAEAL